MQGLTYIELRRIHYLVKVRIKLDQKTLSRYILHKKHDKMEWKRKGVERGKQKIREYQIIEKKLRDLINQAADREGESKID